MNYSKLYLKSHVYLSGFMGTGKTTVGKMLAQKLNIPFIDTDSFLETTLKQTISAIFKKKRGEDFFREQEYLALRTIRHFRPHVVSVGGGAVLKLLNREILRTGIWINLVASPAVIMQRISDPKTRPLLKQKKNLRENIETLLWSRNPFYQLAPYQLDTSFLSPDAVVKKIINIIDQSLFLKPRRGQIF